MGDTNDLDVDRGQDHLSRAGELEKDASARVEFLTTGPRDPRDPGAAAYAALAQVEATLALSHRAAALRTALLDALGDDSNLQSIAQALHDPDSGMRLTEIVDLARQEGGRR